MNKAIKYRIYPDDKQKTLFIKTFGCCRKIWNLMLSDRETAYKKDRTVLKPTPAMYKDAYPYLREVDSLALANVQIALQEAYTRFFTVKGTGRPKFRSRKHARFSYTTNCQYPKPSNKLKKPTIRLEKNSIRLPIAGSVKAVIHRMPDKGWLLKSATVSMEHDGSFFCSLLFEYEADIPEIASPEKNAIGLDYKSDGLYVTSEGSVCGSPKFFRNGQTRLTKAQRKLRHKDKNSNNYRKACKKIAREHRHIANQRRDFLHKLSTEIANQYDMVCVENLNMRAMANKSFRNGKATLDNGYGTFLDMLEYKLHDRGKVLVRIDKWFPSSQTCSCCGTVHHELKDLSIRKWTCSDCGAEHDRDINAAINIMNEGIRQYLAG